MFLSTLYVNTLCKCVKGIHRPLDLGNCVAVYVDCQFLRKHLVDECRGKQSPNLHRIPSNRVCILPNAEYTGVCPNYRHCNTYTDAHTSTHTYARRLERTDQTYIHTYIQTDTHTLLAFDASFSTLRMVVFVHAKRKSPDSTRRWHWPGQDVPIALRRKVEQFALMTDDIVEELGQRPL